tara:strand:+ start:951 stop:1217 length:267 start_codon:yes stop_codon:yes gene_type:complete
MRSLSISCSKHIDQQTIAKKNVRYNLLLADVKRKTQKRLDVQLYKVFELKSQSKEDLTSLCDILEDIHNINKNNNLYKLYDDKLIDID